MDDDPYAFCYQIEKETSAAFDKAGLAAFEKKMRACLEAASTDPSSWPYRRAAEILRAIYCAQKNIPAYIALAEETGLKPEDCLAVAKLLTARKPDEALADPIGQAVDRAVHRHSVSALDRRVQLRPGCDRRGAGNLKP
jgi:hypothetical protein